MKGLILSLAVGLVVSPAVAHAQSDAVSHDKNCRVTVPAGWIVDPVFGLANSPDKKSSVTVSSNKSTKTIAELKQLLPMVYPSATITSSSSTELWMSGKTPNGMQQLVYHAITASFGLCIAEYDFEDNNSAAATNVLKTLQAK
jgi:hypothetical protein